MIRLIYLQRPPKTTLISHISSFFSGVIFRALSFWDNLGPLPAAVAVASPQVDSVDDDIDDEDEHVLSSF